MSFIIIIVGEMMKKILWDLFAKTGNVKYFLLLRKIGNEGLENGNNQSKGNRLNRD